MTGAETLARQPGRAGKTFLLGLSLIGLTAFAYFFYVTTVPSNPHTATNGSFDLGIVRELRAGPGRGFLFNRPLGLYLVPTWLFSYVSHNYLEAHRYASALWGTLSVLATFLLARRLYSTGTAVVVTLALALNFWHVATARFQPWLCAPFGAALTWCAVVWACDTWRLLAAACAGVVLGLSLLLYSPIQILLITVPAWWLWHALVTPGWWRRTIGSVLIIGVVAWFTLTPLRKHAGWSTFFQRNRDVMFDGSEMNGALEGQGALWRQMQRQARVVTGGADIGVNLPIPEPLLNPLEVGFAVIGLVVCVRRLRDPRMTIAPLWLFLTCLAVDLSSVADAGRRLAVALPAWALLAGLGARASVEFLRRHVARRWFLIIVPAAAVGLASFDLTVNAVHLRAFIERMNLANDDPAALEPWPD